MKIALETCVEASFKYARSKSTADGYREKAADREDKAQSYPEDRAH